ncbi:hypothetical protein OAE24_05455 [Candidatus Thioglobus sp.]|nr:hypothetical protein [Candidatus Thioglobus sp.]
MIRLFLSLCSILPLKINHIFGALIGKLLYIFGSEAKKVSVKNVEICFPELSFKDQKSLVKKCINSYRQKFNRIWFNLESKLFKKCQLCL